MTTARAKKLAAAMSRMQIDVGPGTREPTREFMVRGTRFQLAEKYALIKAVGKGAYGVVCSCRDTTTGNKVGPAFLWVCAGGAFKACTKGAFHVPGQNNRAPSLGGGQEGLRCVQRRDRRQADAAGD